LSKFGLYGVERALQRLGVMALFLFAGLPVHAENLFVVAGQGVSVSVGLPDFAMKDTPEEFRSSGPVSTGHYFSIGELIPEGESFEGWTSLFAIKIEEGVGLSFEQYVGQLIGTYLDACDMEVEAISGVEQAENHLRLLVPCQSYRDNSAVGELALFDIRQQEGGYINIYQHWRGDSFDALDIESWPVGRSGIDRFMTIADDAEVFAP